MQLPNRKSLARPVDAASLGVFRFVFGACVAWDAVNVLATGQIWAFYVAPQFHFSYPLAPVPVLPEPWLNSAFVLLAIAAGMLALGLFARTAAALVSAGVTYWFLLDQAVYLNHRYLICLLAFLLIWMPSDRAYSLGRRFGIVSGGTVPFWTVALLRAQMLVVYFFAGVAKINADWLRGAPLDVWLADHSGFPLIGPFIGERSMILAIAWGGMLFDLSIGWLLLWKRTRAAALMLLAAFHACNHFWFDIGVFPFLATGASLIFCEPDWPRRLTDRLRRAVGRDASRLTIDITAGPSILSAATTAFIACWLAVQVLLPLRHWVYPGNVDWTEEGHRFSWQMMLRDKGYLLRRFAVVYPDAPRAAPDHAPEGDAWLLQPVADPVPPLYPLPLPLQAALDPAWARALEQSDLDRLMVEMLPPRERAMLNFDPGEYLSGNLGADAVQRLHELDRALTHRALWGMLQHARRVTDGETMGPQRRRAALLRHLRITARAVLAEVGLELPEAQVERLLSGAEEFDRLRLAGHQAGPMLTRPYMLRQYADHVADRLESLWGVRPRVHVELEVSLNMRPFAPIVDPDVNLAAQPFTLAHAEWLVPLTEPLPPFEQRRRRWEELQRSGYVPE